MGDSYQPLNFEIGNCFGNENDLTNLCKEAKKEEYYKPNKPIESYDNRIETTKNSLGLPTLNLANVELQKNSY